jgi:hypothetical protein
MPRVATRIKGRYVMRNLSLAILLQLLRQRRAMDIVELGRALDAQGVVPSAAVYRDMERGRSLPDTSEAFVRVYAHLLSLTNDELQVLLVLWALAVLCDELGEDLAMESMTELLRVPTPA